MKQPHTLFLFLLSILFLLPGAGYSRAENQPIPLVDGESLGEAAALVVGFQRFIRSSTEFCNKTFPGSEFSLKMADAIWRDESSTEFLAAEAALATAFKSESSKLLKAAGNKMKLTQLSKLTHSESKEFCKNLAASVFTGLQAISERMPNASRLLRDEFLLHPELDEPKAKMRQTVGCLKKLSNERYRDWEKSFRFCDCNTESIFRTLSKEERLILESASATGQGTSYLTSLPNYKKVQEELRGCVMKSPEPLADNKSNTAVAK